MTKADNNSVQMLQSNPPQRPRGAAGRFVSRYVEKRGNAIALRLPQSLDSRLREAIGWRSKADNKMLTAWVEAAIQEKLSRLAE